jgi:hypothetical protein
VKQREIERETLSQAVYRIDGMANLDGSLLSNFCLPVPTRVPIEFYLR